jgi:predicted dehydrogenase
MKVALLGTGFGQAHAAVYAARGDVDVVVFGRTPAQLEQIRDTFGFATTTDLDGIYTDSSFDLIDICLPTGMHAEHALRALAAGNHVLCELPLALSMTDAQRVADTAADSDRQVFVDMAGRFSPAYRLLRDSVDDRTYGRLQALELELRSALLWPGYDLRSDTIVIDMLHGELDTLVRLLGMPESTATATAAGTEQGSAVHAIFTYPDAIARVSGSALMPVPYGVQGGYRATFTDGVLEHTFTADFTGQAPHHVVHEHTKRGHREIPAEGSDAFTAVIDHVLACLRGEASNQLTPASVLDSLELTLDVHRAVNRREGNTPATTAP